MKHLITLLAALSLTWGGGARAQLSELSSATVSGVGGYLPSVSQIEEGQWYVLYQQRVYNSQNGSYISDENGVGNQVYMAASGTSSVTDGMTATAAAPYLVRMTATADGYYTMQFGTGNWIGLSGTKIYSYADEGDATTWRFYDIDGVCVGITNTVQNMRLDNNGAGRAAVLYSDATDDITTYTTSNNNVWQIFPVALQTYDTDDYAYMKLKEVYATYQEYSGTFVTGTVYGTYGADEVAAFEAALAAVAVLDDEGKTFTSEDYDALREAIEQAYAAVLASYIDGAEMEVTEGYYYIEGVPDFYASGTKGMYSYAEGGVIYGAWATTDRSVAYLWHISRSDQQDTLSYVMQNMATDAVYNEIVKGTAATMTRDQLNPVVFSYYSTNADGTFNVTIRLSAQDADSYYYMQQIGHSNGSGDSGSVGGWLANTAASAWTLVSVDPEEAEALIEANAGNKADEQRYLDALSLIATAQAQADIALDMVGTVGLITSASQLSSPYSDTTQGVLANLIDGDATTFWHSNWHSYDGDAVGDHYLQVQMPDDIDQVVAQMTRRNNAKDHITLFGVYGTNADNTNLGKDDCTWVATLSLPYTEAGETLTTDPFVVNGYQYLRFYIEETSTGNVYGHMAEFQLYDYGEKETSQAVAMGSVYTNLTAAIAAAQAEGADITASTYAALQEAYQAFSAVFVDPTELRLAMVAATVSTEVIVQGSNPGQWTDLTVQDDIAAAVAAASKYDEAGEYTQAQSDAYVQQLGQLAASVLTTANGVQEGRWYEIRFGTEEEYEAQGWDTSAGEASGVHQALFGKYLTVANLTEDYEVEYIPRSQIDDLCVGQRLYFQDRDDVDDDALARYRFISVGDTAYIMQHQATGLFLRAYGTSGYVSLSPHPTLFNVEALGYGQVQVSARTLSGDSQSNLHAQRNYNMLVTYATSGLGTNSALCIEDVAADVASDYAPTACNLAAVPGQVYALCYATQMTAQSGTMYGVQVQGSTATLSPLADNTAAPGQPFVYVSGSLADYDSEADSQPMPFAHGYQIAPAPQQSGSLVGVYYAQTLPAGVAKASANGFAVTEDATTAANNSAYLCDLSGVTELTIEVSTDTYDAVNAVAAALGSGAIYTLDGQRVQRITAPGVYIIGSRKLIVR